MGKARIARAGRDMTIVAYSAMVHEALAVAEEVALEGTEIEVVDLRSVKPLDTDTVMASVARTGRLLCVGEAWPWGGVTAEVIARVASEGFGLLDAPPQRLNAKDTPVPVSSESLEGPSPNRPADRLGFTKPFANVILFSSSAGPESRRVGVEINGLELFRCGPGSSALVLPF